jgi:hypothetical protein
VLFSGSLPTSLVDGEVFVGPDFMLMVKEMVLVARMVAFGMMLVVLVVK